VITFHGKDGRVFWFIIRKLDRVYTYPNAPRHSSNDAAELCGKMQNVIIWRDITVGDLWKTKVVASMPVLEEGIFNEVFLHSNHGTGWLRSGLFDTYPGRCFNMGVFFRNIAMFLALSMGPT
jgi:hypothetical protein